MIQHPFLSEQASQQLVDSIVNIAEKLALEKVKQSRKRYLIQKEVMEEYNVTHKVITEWEMNGLRKVKIGKTIRHDRHDIEDVIEQMKN
ncbi:MULTISPECIES: DNA-binding protein [unclassified Staphylococcus]|uniref:DNA-binding protein n=1 Tax=unclassified Staphylococcus TaxID=91994 RepID=UPI0021CF3A08|nr:MULTISPECIES: DNA-binding protein [unclassified Staphylococcus]UXR78294.1 DNA-binding protein [Staphylococcus sp. IVB6227]UXR82459.1 DNA-binding protein [Staphylococcus sp. IVB6214]